MSYQEAKVARVSEMKDGDMKKITAGEKEILLARVDGDFHALHPYCTHYGAPLEKGLLSGGRLRCPWHHACFDVTTGRHVEAPGIDGLPRYELRIDGEDVVVRIPEDGADRIANPMAKRDENDERLFAVLGAGAAGAYAAEGMREAGYTGRILMITEEDELPYDRPNVSKAYLSGEAPEEWMPLRDPHFYREHGIEVIKGQRVAKVDGPNKRITFEDRETVRYDKLLLCTGAVPRPLPVEGHDLKNVFTLRSLDDSRRLRAITDKGTKVVVIGASFIGMESAASLLERGAFVTVVAPEALPFERIFGPQVGRMMQDLHETAGVKFELGRKVERLEGGVKVERVVLDNGLQLDAEIVLAGIGVRPNTDFFKGIPLEIDGTIRTDEFLQVYDDLYAAGDIARFPYRSVPTRIEHWQVACNQGRIAGMNMAGAEKPFDIVPFFWTRQQGHSLTYVGHAPDFDRVRYDGLTEMKKFLAFYIKDGKIRAVAGMGRSTDMLAIHELMKLDAMPLPEALDKEPLNWLEQTKSAAAKSSGP